MKKGKLYQVSIDEIEYQPHFIMVYASEDAKDKDLQRLATNFILSQNPELPESALVDSVIVEPRDRTRNQTLWPRDCMSQRLRGVSKWAYCTRRRFTMLPTMTMSLMRWLTFGAKQRRNDLRPRQRQKNLLNGSTRIVKLFHWKKVTTMIDQQQAQVAWSEVIEELDSDTFNRLRHALELVDAYIRQGTEIERGL